MRWDGSLVGWVLGLGVCSKEVMSSFLGRRDCVGSLGKVGDQLDLHLMSLDYYFPDLQCT